MKIPALTGSPRKGSNTYILVDNILEGAKSHVEMQKSVWPGRVSVNFLMLLPKIVGKK